MSHYTVLVLLSKGQELKNQLAPYDEGLEASPRISSTREEFIKDTRKYYKDQPEIFNLSDDEFIEVMRAEYQLDADGNELTTYNEISKWDWWSVGGRWSDILKLTPEANKMYEDGEASSDELFIYSSGINPGYCNAARIKYLDFSPDQEKYKKSIRFWEIVVEGDSPKNEEENKEVEFVRHKPEFYVKRYGTKENYADMESRFTTWAVLTPNGEWHQEGKMGWWACSDETDDEAAAWIKTYKEKFIDSADPEWVAVIVDCHI
jgi:hypothetical protein